MPALHRYETVDWSAVWNHGDSTLGELRTLLREVADWPDDANMECKQITLRRPLPIVTANEAGHDSQ